MVTAQGMEGLMTDGSALVVAFAILISGLAIAAALYFQQSDFSSCFETHVQMERDVYAVKAPTAFTEEFAKERAMNACQPK